MVWNRHIEGKSRGSERFKIHKYAAINFQAFENIIDALGGIDVYVEKDIYDEQYPDGAGGVTLYAVKTTSYHFSGAEALNIAGADIQLLILIAQNASRKF